MVQCETKVDETDTLKFHVLLSHGSVLAWRIPCTEEPGGSPRTRRD